MLKRILNISAWVAACAALVFLLAFTNNQRHAALCSAVKINITRTNVDNRFLDSTVITQQFHNQDLRKANIGVVGGIDINILHMVLSGRVGTDLQKNTTNNTLAPSYKNIWGQVGVGFRF